MSVIAYRFKGQEMDTAILERFLLNNTLMGMASAHAEAGKAPYVAAIKVALENIKGPQLDGIQKLLARWKDRDVLMYFVNAEKGVKAVQPFEILFNTDNKPSVVAFSLNLKGNDQITKFLMPAVQKLLPKDGDLEQLLEDMKDTSFGESLNKMYEDDEGVSVFLYANGDSLILGPEGVTGEDREWGWATHYYEEEPAASADSETDESDAALADLLGEEEPELPINEPAKPTDAPKSKFKVPDKGGTKPPVVETKKLDVTGSKLEIEHEKHTPKAGMREKEFDKYVLKYMDVVPKNAFAQYQQNKFFIMVPKTAIASAMTAAVGKVNPSAIQQQRPPVEEHAGLKRLDQLPIMSDTTRQEVTTILKDPKFKDFMDKDKLKIIDPSKYKDYDKKLASFSEQLGIPNIDMTLNWPEEVCTAIAQAENGLEALRVWNTWLRYELAMARQKSQSSEEDQVDTSGSGVVAEEVVEPVKKKSGFKPPQGMRNAG